MEPSESVTHRIQSAGNNLVDALLFLDDEKLTAQIRRTLGFANSCGGPDRTTLRVKRAIISNGNNLEAIP